MIYGILLAAGNSERYGCNKLLEKLSDGQTIIEKSGSKLIACVDNAIAVVRGDNIELADRLELLGFEILLCPDSHLGIGASLSSAIKHIQNAHGYVVSLGDMPFIKQKTIEKVVHLLGQNKSIVMPRYKKSHGHPVGFNYMFKNELSQLNGDQGGKNIINMHSKELFVFDCDDAGVLMDIDTKDDYLLMNNPEQL